MRDEAVEHDRTNATMRGKADRMERDRASKAKRDEADRMECDEVKSREQASGVEATGLLCGADALLPEGFLVGNAHSEKGETGCTVILCPAGAVAGADVRGAAPATRETDLLKPENLVQEIHAVVLSGGSAFGLDAASGVMRYLEEQGAGLTFANVTVPLVVGASLFDLLGDSAARPDTAMGYAACENAGRALAVGRVGAGRGATVGKLLGPASAMPGGLGACSFVSGELLVTALVAVNALGNIYDASSGRALAGTLDPLSESVQIIDPLQAFALISSAPAEHRGATRAEEMGGNTTLGCILTNADLSKAQATRVAMMAHDGYARAIHPVHTSNDGDVIFCMAHGSVGAHPDLVGTLAALAMEHAIHNAVC
jgi:L-aminopeptidase/D-esterase-like protein